MLLVDGAVCGAAAVRSQIMTAGRSPISPLAPKQEQEQHQQDQQRQQYQAGHLNRGEGGVGTMAIPTALSRSCSTNSMNDGDHRRKMATKVTPPQERTPGKTDEGDGLTPGVLNPSRRAEGKTTATLRDHAGVRAELEKMEPLIEQGPRWKLEKFLHAMDRLQEIKSLLHLELASVEAEDDRAALKQQGQQRQQGVNSLSSSSGSSPLLRDEGGSSSPSTPAASGGSPLSAGEVSGSRESPRATNLQASPLLTTARAGSPLTLPHPPQAGTASVSKAALVHPSLDSQKQKPPLLQVHGGAETSPSQLASPSAKAMLGRVRGQHEPRADMEQSGSGSSDVGETVSPVCNVLEAELADVENAHKEERNGRPGGPGRAGTAGAGCQVAGGGGGGCGSGCGPMCCGTKAVAGKRLILMELLERVDVLVRAAVQQLLEEFADALEKNSKPFDSASLRAESERHLGDSLLGRSMTRTNSSASSSGGACASALRLTHSATASRPIHGRTQSVGGDFHRVTSAPASTREMAGWAEAAVAFIGPHKRQGSLLFDDPMFLQFNADLAQQREEQQQQQQQQKDGGGGCHKGSLLGDGKADLPQAMAAATAAAATDVGGKLSLHDAQTEAGEGGETGVIVAVRPRTSPYPAASSGTPSVGSGAPLGSRRGADRRWGSPMSVAARILEDEASPRCEGAVGAGAHCLPDLELPGHHQAGHDDLESTGPDGSDSSRSPAGSSLFSPASPPVTDGRECTTKTDGPAAAAAAAAGGGGGGGARSGGDGSGCVDSRGQPSSLVSRPRRRHARTNSLMPIPHSPDSPSGGRHSHQQLQQPHTHTLPPHPHQQLHHLQDRGNPARPSTSGGRFFPSSSSLKAPMSPAVLEEGEEEDEGDGDVVGHALNHPPRHHRPIAGSALPFGARGSMGGHDELGEAASLGVGQGLGAWHIQEREWLPALSQQALPWLRRMAKRLCAAGAADRCAEAYRRVRAAALLRSLKAMDMVELRVRALNAMPWPEMEACMKGWIRDVNIVAYLLLEGERHICEKVLGKLRMEWRGVLYAMLHESRLHRAVTMLCLNLHTIARTNKTPEKIFWFLNMLRATDDVTHSFEEALVGAGKLEVLESWLELPQKLAEAVYATLDELRATLTAPLSAPAGASGSHGGSARRLFPNLTKRLTRSGTVDGGYSSRSSSIQAAADVDVSVHAVTSYVVNYITKLMERDSEFFPQLSRVFTSFTDADRRPRLLETELSRVLEALEANIERRSTIVAPNQPVHAALFVINNAHYLSRCVSIVGIAEAMKHMDWIEHMEKKFDSAVLRKLSTALGHPADSSRLDRSEVRSRLQAFNSGFEELALEQRNWFVLSDMHRKATRIRVSRSLKEMYTAFLMPHREALSSIPTYRWTPDGIERTMQKTFFLNCGVPAVASV